MPRASWRAKASNISTAAPCGSGRTTRAASSTARSPSMTRPVPCARSRIMPRTRNWTGRGRARPAGSRGLSVPETGFVPYTGTRLLREPRMFKPKIAPPPLLPARGSAVPPPPRPGVAQRAAAVTFAPTKRAAGRGVGAASELMSQPDGSFRLRSLDRGTLAPPSGVFNFARVQGVTRNDAHIYASSQLPHASLAQGKPVIYAGTAKFDAGKLEWWSNYSGTYQPIAEF